ncbi:MAG: ribonuclease Z [Lentimicrobiaceae bacterium]|nr:ribonuclease Z [Lentimicrobiaceae bacterium]
MPPFEVTIIGSSSATPIHNRMPSSQCVKYNNECFLFDCGEGTQITLRKLKISFNKINNIFISHLHGDHYFGLVGLLSSMHLMGRTNPITVYAPPQLKDIIKIQFAASETVLTYEINFVDTNVSGVNTLYENKRIVIKSFPVKHSIPTTGFIILEKPSKRRLKKNVVQTMQIPISEIGNIKNGKDIVLNGKLIKNEDITLNPKLPRSYAYSADTMYCEDIIPVISNVSLLYHETTFARELDEAAKSKFHSTTIDAATIALKANVKQLLIGHFSARYETEDLEHLLKEAKTVFENTVLAIDGQTHVIEH